MRKNITIYVSRITPLLVLMFGLLITYFGWKYTSQEVEREAEKAFRNIAREHTRSVKNRMQTYEQALRGGVAFFNASDKVTREGWRTFVESLRLEKIFPGIQGYGLSIFIKPEDLQGHLVAIRGEGFPDYKIRPEGEREIYTSIIFLEPFDERNRQAFGYDMFSNPTRRIAMEHARDTGLPTLSGKVTLVQEIKGKVQAGTLLFLPVYDKSMPANSTLEERREAIIGYVYAPFRIDDLMVGIFDTGYDLIDVHIFDGKDPEPSSLMFDSDEILTHDVSPVFSIQEIVEIAGHEWTLKYFSNKKFMKSLDFTKPVIAATGGVIFSILIFAFTWSVVTSQGRSLRMAQRMTGELRESEKRFSTIVNMALNGIITINENGIAETFNPGAERIFGYTAAEVVGKNIKMLMPEPYRGSHDGYLANYRNTGVKKIIGIGREVVGLRKDGSTFPISLAVSEMILDDKRLFLGIVSDISEQKKAEQEIIEARKAAESYAADLKHTLLISEGLREEAQKAKEEAESFAREAETATKAKSEFLASMSHEIRTPMNAIIGMADLLSETELTEVQKNYINTFKNAGENLLGIINDILDISKIEAGHLELENNGFDLGEIVLHVVEIMKFRAREKKLEIAYSIEPDVPRKLLGDSMRLQQILINLLGNAVKFTEKGAISITVQINRLVNDKADLLFSVKDEGIGIPPEMQNSIFNAFSQADASVTRKYGGTGLGLTISKTLINLMGGEIGLKSEVGKGSDFIFNAIFDLNKASSGKVKMSVVETKESAGEREGMRDLAILLVEDNLDNRNLVLAYLKSTQHKIDIAENGQIAFDKFTSGKYDLVLMDIEMPVMDGLTATKKIREWESREKMKRTPILALTAHALMEHETKSREAGCDDHLTKPIRKAKLMEALGRYS